MERQRPPQKREMVYATQSMQEMTQIHQYEAPSTAFSYSRQSTEVSKIEVPLERLYHKRNASEGVSHFKGNDEEGRSFEDSEIKSTTLSCYEKQSAVDYHIKLNDHSSQQRYEQPELERDDSEGNMTGLKNNDDCMINSEKGLLDQLFEKNNQEFSDYDPNLSY